MYEIILWITSCKHLFRIICCCCWCSVTQLCPTLCNPMDCSQRLLCPWNVSAMYTGVGCHFLLQKIFLTQGLNPCLLRLHTGRQILYHWAVGVGGKLFYVWLHWLHCCCCLVSKSCQIARILERVAISFSRGSSQPRDQTGISCTGRQILYH